MPTTFTGGAVWDAVTAACRTRGPRVAAIAYLGPDAPRLLPLKKGDLLYCNASDQALLTRATSPDALAAYLDRGVTVRSCPTLHAKVLVTATHAVVGSANASANSTRLTEAVIVTTDRSVRNAAARFARNPGRWETVDKRFLQMARQLWDRGRSFGPNGAAAVSSGLIPAEHRLYISYFTKDSVLTDAEEDLYRSRRRRLRRQAGPAATYELDVVALGRGIDPNRVNDVLLFVDDDWLYPPVVVVSEPLTAPRSRRKFHITRSRTGLDPVPVDKAYAALEAAGVTPSLHPRQVRSAAAREALLGLWPELAAERE